MKMYLNKAYDPRKGIGTISRGVVMTLLLLNGTKSRINSTIGGTGDRAIVGINFGATQAMVGKKGL